MFRKVIIKRKLAEVRPYNRMPFPYTYDRKQHPEDAGKSYAFGCVSISLLLPYRTKFHHIPNWIPFFVKNTLPVFVLIPHPIVSSALKVSPYLMPAPCSLNLSPVSP